MVFPKTQESIAIITCSTTVFNPRDWLARWGSGGRLEAMFALRLKSRHDKATVVDPLDNFHDLLGHNTLSISSLKGRL